MRHRRPKTFHGLTNAPEYRSWHAMIRRCTVPEQDSYPRYGGRGIRVCQRWMDSMAAFYEDMGPRPSAKHSIDRIDKDGNYEPGNCRWATPKEQSYNTSTNTLLTAFGETKCVAEWADDPRCAVCRGTMYDRLIAGHLSHEEVITRPKGAQRRNPWPARRRNMEHRKQEKANV